MRFTLRVALFLCAFTTIFPALDASAQSAAFIGKSFQPPGNGVAAADFNRDGKLDLAVASGGVSILLGNGDGTFQPAVSYPAGNSVTSIAVGDFNNDGKPDVAVASAGTSEVSILLGNGDGTLQAAKDFPVNGTAQEVSIATGDFNGDGKLDVVVADQTNCGGTCTTVSVLLGNGDGTLQAAQHVTVAAGPNGVAVGDFNGDGRADLAVTDSRGNVWILIGNGDGTFRTPVAIPLPDSGGTGAFGIAVADLNGDAKLDLAVAAPFAEYVYVLIGNGDGTFKAPVGYQDALAQEPDSVAVGDFNGDGKKDLAVALSECCNASGEGVLGIMAGNGDGTFKSMVRYIIPDPPMVAPIGANFVAVADVNNDGKADVLISNGGPGGTTVMLNRTGQSNATPSLASIAISPGSVTGGTTAIATATLAPNSVAPSGNLTVSLSNSNTGAAYVPANVTIVNGMANALFQVQTNSGVTSTSTATISGTLSGTTKSASVIITPPATPPAVSSITVQPSTFQGGVDPNVNVYLNEPAPFSGANVTLTSSNTSVLTVPSPMTISSPFTSGQTIATTTAVSSTTTVTLTASYGGKQASTTVTITPPSTLSVASLTLNPSSVVGGNTSQATVTLSAAAPSGGAAVSIGSSTTAAVPSVVTLNIPAGQTTGTFSISTSVVSSTTTATISAALNGSTQYATLTITAGGNGSIPVSSLTINPNSVTSGTTSQGNVGLAAAPTANTAVTLSSSNPSVASVPATVTVAAGTTNATFNITTGSVSAATTATITATLGSSQNATIMVSPGSSSGVTLSSLTLNPTSVRGGGTSQGTVKLSGPAPSDTVVSLSSSKTSVATVPSSVTVAAGASSATFTVQTSRVSSSTSVTISASYAGATKTASLNVTRY